MFRRSISRVISAFCLFMLLAPAGYAQTDSAEGLRIEFPEGGHLRIENQFGEVSAEVWTERHVAVSASVAGGRELTRSPVVIENRKQLGAINIVRRPTDPVAAIKLSIKIPVSAHVEIVGGKYAISLRGTPKSTSIRSGAGNVTVEFQGPANADITARSLNGLVRSELPQLLSEGKVLQARVGTGERTLRLTANGGDIILSQPIKLVAAKGRAEDFSTPEVQPPAAGVPAPATDEQEISEGDIIRVDSQLVTLNMSVIDRNTNRGLTGLSKSDFRLFENGAEQQIVQFESSSAPFDLLLLIDLSGSTRDVLSLIRAAALRFVDAARPYDRIGVIAFAGRPTVVSPLTLDRRLLRQRINAMETIRTGDTKLYDATDFTVNQVLEDAKSRRRTAIIVMSDGLDGSIDGVQGDGSVLGYKELLGRLQEFDGVLYTLWLNTEYQALHPQDTQPEAFDAGHDRMKEMADMGGGLFYEVERLTDLAGAYERVVADLGTVYSLAYRPSDKTRDGKWRAIRVNIDRPAAVARGKRGYYAN
jgi:VWFA-related protein